MLPKIFAAAAFLGLASAQSDIEVIPVLVGMSPNGTAGTFFSPDRVTAPVGSMVQFQFLGGNHTVTQSSLAEPCVPLSESNSSAESFHSGYVPAMNNEETGEVPVYTIMIKDTKPIWAYCAQGMHCQAGMSMVINENTENPDASLEKYREAAAAVERATAPDAPPEGQAGGDAADGGEAGEGGEGGEAGEGGDSAGDEGAGGDGAEGGDAGGEGTAEGAAGEGAQIAAAVGLHVPAALLAAAMGAAALF